MALRQTLLLLLLLNVCLIYSFPAGEENISDGPAPSRLHSPRLRYDPRKLRVPPNQRTSTKRDFSKDDDDQKKRIHEVQDRVSERINRPMAQANKQKYLYQTEANINKNVDVESLSLNQHDSEIQEKSETSNNEYNNNDQEDVSAKSRDIKESILKSNTKSKVKSLENRAHYDKGNRRLQVSLPTNSDERHPQEPRTQSEDSPGILSGKPDPERYVFTKAHPVPDDDGEKPSEEGNTNLDGPESNYKLAGQRFDKDFFLTDLQRRSHEGGQAVLKDDQRQFFSDLSPFSEQYSPHALINRHKKQPSELGIFLPDPSYTLKTIFEGRDPGFSIAPEEWRGEDVLDEVASETPTPKGFPKQSKQMLEFGTRRNYESDKSIGLHPKPENVQTQNSPSIVEEIKLFTPQDENRMASSSSSISSEYADAPISTTTTTPRPEDWSAERAQYSFSTNQEDRISDLSHERKENRAGGIVRGSYSYSDGYVLRTVEYIADKNGYRIVNEKSVPLSPEGPIVNPNGHAAVKAEVDGHGYDYIVHGHELPRRRNYYNRMKLTRNEQ